MFRADVDKAAANRAIAALVARIQKKVSAGCSAAAEVLADRYQQELLMEQAPPHSDPGQIPHKYDGIREGGYVAPEMRDEWLASTSGMPAGMSPGNIGDIFNVQFDPATTFQFDGQPQGRVKNNQAGEFAKTQGDDEFLATFIRSASTETGGVVGFTAEGSHVAHRDQNYLIQWDQGEVPEFPGVERPWVDEIYSMAKPDMRDAFQQILAGGGSTDSVPF